MGALTSKPFSFRARPWELRVFPYYDIFSVFLSPLRFHVCNNDLIRVLPVADPIYVCWVFDNVRFSYDALNMQRLTYPYRRLGFFA
jgi:NADH-quinone oxidoreductase subunit G